MEQTVELSTIWDVMTLMWRQCNAEARNMSCREWCNVTNRSCKPQARATPSWWTQNKCCPHSLLPGIEYSRHVTPWAISGVPHYRLKSIKVFMLITSRTLPKKCMHSGKYMTFLKIIHTSMTRYICALAVLFKKLRWHKQPQVRLQNIQYYCLRCNRLVCRMTPWVSVRVVRVLQCSTAARHVISGKRRNYGMYCHVV